MNQFSKLNQKQLMFAIEYMRCSNATEAAKKAGYSEKTAGSIGHELLKKPEILNFIEENKKEAVQKLNIDQDKILESIAAIAFFDPMDVLEFKNGSFVFKRDIAKKALLGANFAIYPEYQNKEDKKRGDIRARLTITAGDRKGALELLGKHLGMWKDSNAGLGTGEGTRKATLQRLSELVGRVKRRGQDTPTET